MASKKKKTTMNSSILGLLSKLIFQSGKAKAIKYILDCVKQLSIGRTPFLILLPVHKEVVELLKQGETGFGNKSLLQMIK